MKKTLGLVVLALNASFVFAAAPNVENVGSVRGILTDLRSKATAQAAPAVTTGADWDPWNDVPAPPSSGLDFTSLIPVDYHGATDFPKDAGWPLTMEAGLSRFGADYDVLVDFTNPKPVISVRNSTAHRECADCQANDTMRNYGKYQPYDYTTKDLQDLRAAVERSYEDWSSRYKEHPMTIGAEKVLQALDKAIQP